MKWELRIRKGESGRIDVALPYDPTLVGETAAKKGEKNHEN